MAMVGPHRLQVVVLGFLRPIGRRADVQASIKKDWFSALYFFNGEEIDWPMAHVQRPLCDSLSGGNVAGLMAYHCNPYLPGVSVLL